ncbi:MAG: response regulator [Alphaproteobacteria bacterium]|nr:response regulator [Alphaproteobacteria bacterium]
MARILVAEDDMAVGEFIRRALTHKGYDVTIVGDGLEALQALSESEDDGFDLLLTDIVMPGLDGIALSQRVRSEHPGLPILMMSGYAAERQRAHDIDAMSHRVIPKPFSLREICEAVTDVLAAPPALQSSA